MALTTFEPIALGPRPVFAAFVLASALLALANAIDVVITVPVPSLGLRALHLLTDGAEHLSLGIVLGAGLAAVVAVRPRAAFALGAFGAGAAVHVACGYSIWRRIMASFDGRVEWAVYVPAIVLGGLLGPGLFVLGWWLGRFRRAFAIAPVAAVATLAIDDVVQPDQYFGEHALVACAAGIFAGAALARRFDAQLPRLDRSGSRRRIALAAVVATLLVALVPPPNAVRIELFKTPSAVGAWTLATTVWRAPAPAAGAVPIAPAPAPSAPGPLERPEAGAPVVVLLTVDAVRADLVEAASPRVPLPTLTAMKTGGAHFTDVVTPGSQTAVSLATMFSGRYFSQLRWEKHGTGARRFSYPATDPAPRFPELLTAAGVSTAMVGGLLFLEDHFGVVRGFGQQRILAKGSEHASGHDVIAALLDQLRAVEPGRPAFLYAHLLEPHAPYDRGAKNDGPEIDRYASEVALVDSLVSRVARALEQTFGRRGILIVTSDHGEAFGEHGTTQHSKTVYQEVLRVPLLIHGRSIEARRIDERVGLVDVGPTILDLFGVPVPASFMGQSLVPLLHGETGARRPRSSPLFAEARLKRAIFLDDIKVIDDVRRKTVEAYDLSRDDGELHNVFGRDPRADVALATLREFFRGSPEVFRP